MYKFVFFNTHLAAAVALYASPVKWQACAGGICRYQLVTNLGGQQETHKGALSSQCMSCNEPAWILPLACMFACPCYSESVSIEHTPLATMLGLQRSSAHRLVHVAVEFINTIVLREQVAQCHNL
jgi:hypothetical protein